MKVSSKILATCSLAILLGATGSANAENQIVLEGIVVVGEAINKDVDEQQTPGLSSTSITSRELEITNPGDLSDVFQAIPGVTVGSSLPISQKIYVNGVEETNLAVTIDGSRQNNKIFHHNATTYIDPELLKAARIYAGVAPADAGPGALGGSIAFETVDVGDLLEPGKSVGAFIKGSYETNGDIFSTSVAGYRRSEGGFEVLGYLKYADGDTRQSGDGEDILGSTTSLMSGLGKLAYQGKEGDRFEFSYESVNDDAIRPFRADFGGLIRGGVLSTDTRPYDLRRQNVVLSYKDETPTGLWDPRLRLAYSVTDLKTTYGTEDIAGKTDSINGKFENRFAIGEHSVTAGLDFYKDTANFEDSSSSFGESIKNIGTYVQARLNPVERVRLSFGGRLDNQWFEGIDGTNINTSGLSGNISGEYDITSWLTANAGYSHKWAGVPLAENFIMNPVWDYSQGIEDVSSDNVVAGLKFKHGGFSLLGRVFQTDIHNARVALYGADQYGRALDVHTEGYDLAGEYKWSTGFVRLAYTNIDAEINGKPADSYSGRYLTTPVGEIITAQIVNTFAGTGFTVGVDTEIALDNTDKADASNQIIQGYQVVNAFVEYKPEQFKNVTLRFDAKNILDEDYASRASYGQEFETVVPLKEPGRSFKVNAKVKF